MPVPHRSTPWPPCLAPRSDVWSLDLSAMTWTHLWAGMSGDRGPQQSGGPRGRKGCACAVVTLPTADGGGGGVPYLVIHGGRDDSPYGPYFLDIWAFNLRTLAWSNWTPLQGPMPSGRDHHSAFLVESFPLDSGPQFAIWGGRR